MVYAFGGYVHAGKYEVEDIFFNIVDDTVESGYTSVQLEIGDKYFYGGGVSGEVAFMIPFKKIDWRIIGVKLSMQYEDGSYARLRKRLERINVAEDPDPFVFETTDFEDLAPNRISLNISATSEFIYRINKNSHLGFWSSMGVGNQIFTTAAGVYFSYDRITGILSSHASIPQGVIYSTGVSYRL
ncbi:hypothetical protein [Aquimarina agarilytica]|uniref:hypothetical protein n=1 Tax=Aquimarina agarilytica TaxID=1087449 RepID=UPI00028A111C|nr:hypothetical protein [Aquimarina agarilytica]